MFFNSNIEQYLSEKYQFDKSVEIIKSSLSHKKYLSTNKKQRHLSNSLNAYKNPFTKNKASKIKIDQTQTDSLILYCKCLIQQVEQEVNLYFCPQNGQKQKKIAAHLLTKINAFIQDRVKEILTLLKKIKSNERHKMILNVIASLSKTKNKYFMNLISFAMIKEVLFYIRKVCKNAQVQANQVRALNVQSVKNKHRSLHTKTQRKVLINSMGKYQINLKGTKHSKSTHTLRPQSSLHKPKYQQNQKQIFQLISLYNLDQVLVYVLENYQNQGKNIFHQGDDPHMLRCFDQIIVGLMDQSLQRNVRILYQQHKFQNFQYNINKTRTILDQNIFEILGDISQQPLQPQIQTINQQKQTVKFDTSPVTFFQTSDFKQFQPVEYPLKRSLKLKSKLSLYSNDEIIKQSIKKGDKKSIKRERGSINDIDQVKKSIQKKKKLKKAMSYDYFHFIKQLSQTSQQMEDEKNAIEQIDDQQFVNQIYKSKQKPKHKNRNSINSSRDSLLLNNLKYGTLYKPNNSSHRIEDQQSNNKNMLLRNGRNNLMHRRSGMVGIKYESSSKRISTRWNNNFMQIKQGLGLYDSINSLCQAITKKPQTNPASPIKSTLKSNFSLGRQQSLKQSIIIDKNIQSQNEIQNKSYIRPQTSTSFINKTFNLFNFQHLTGSKYISNRFKQGINNDFNHQQVVQDYVTQVEDKVNNIIKKLFLFRILTLLNSISSFQFKITKSFKLITSTFNMNKNYKCDKKTFQEEICTNKHLLQGQKQKKQTENSRKTIKHKKLRFQKPKTSKQLKKAYYLKRQSQIKKYLNNYFARRQNNFQQKFKKYILSKKKPRRYQNIKLKNPSKDLLLKSFYLFIDQEKAQNIQNVINQQMKRKHKFQIMIFENLNMLETTKQTIKKQSQREKLQRLGSIESNYAITNSQQVIIQNHYKNNKQVNEFYRTNHNHMNQDHKKQYNRQSKIQVNIESDQHIELKRVQSLNLLNSQQSIKYLQSKESFNSLDYSNPFDDSIILLRFPIQLIIQSTQNSVHKLIHKNIKVLVTIKYNPSLQIKQQIDPKQQKLYEHKKRIAKKYKSKQAKLSTINQLSQQQKQQGYLTDQQENNLQSQFSSSSQQQSEQSFKSISHSPSSSQNSNSSNSDQSLEQAEFSQKQQQQIIQSKNSLYDVLQNNPIVKGRIKRHRQSKQQKKEAYLKFIKKKDQFQQGFNYLQNNIKKLIQKNFIIKKSDIGYRIQPNLSKHNKTTTDFGIQKQIIIQTKRLRIPKISTTLKQVIQSLPRQLNEQLFKIFQSKQQFKAFQTNRLQQSDYVTLELEIKVLNLHTEVSKISDKKLSKAKYQAETTKKSLGVSTYKLQSQINIIQCFQRVQITKKINNYFFIKQILTIYSKNETNHSKNENNHSQNERPKNTFNNQSNYTNKGEKMIQFSEQTYCEKFHQLFQKQTKQIKNGKFQTQQTINSENKFLQIYRTNKFKKVFKSDIFQKYKQNLMPVKERKRISAQKAISSLLDFLYQHTKKIYDIQVQQIPQSSSKMQVSQIKITQHFKPFSKSSKIANNLNVPHFVTNFMVDQFTQKVNKNDNKKMTQKQITQKLRKNDKIRRRSSINLLQKQSRIKEKYMAIYNQQQQLKKQRKQLKKTTIQRNTQLKKTINIDEKSSKNIIDQKSKKSICYEQTKKQQVFNGNSTQKSSKSLHSKSPIMRNGQFIQQQSVRILKSIKQLQQFREKNLTKKRMTLPSIGQITFNKKQKKHYTNFHSKNNYFSFKQIQHDSNINQAHKHQGKRTNFKQIHKHTSQLLTTSVMNKLFFVVKRSHKFILCHVAYCILSQNDYYMQICTGLYQKSNTNTKIIIGRITKTIFQYFIKAPKLLQYFINCQIDSSIEINSYRAKLKQHVKQLSLFKLDSPINQLYLSIAKLIKMRVIAKFPKIIKYKKKLKSCTIFQKKFAIIKIMAYQRFSNQQIFISAYLPKTSKLYVFTVQGDKFYIFLKSILQQNLNQRNYHSSSKANSFENKSQENTLLVKRKPRLSIFGPNSNSIIKQTQEKQITLYNKNNSQLLKPEQIRMNQKFKESQYKISLNDRFSSNQFSINQLSYHKIDQKNTSNSKNQQLSWIQLIDKINLHKKKLRIHRFFQVYQNDSEILLALGDKQKCQQYEGKQTIQKKLHYHIQWLAPYSHNKKPPYPSSHKLEIIKQSPQQPQMPQLYIFPKCIQLLKLEYRQQKLSLLSCFSYESFQQIKIRQAFFKYDRRLQHITFYNFSFRYLFLGIRQQKQIFNHQSHQFKYINRNQRLKPNQKKPKLRVAKMMSYESGMYNGLNNLNKQSGLNKLNNQSGLNKLNNQSGLNANNNNLRPAKADAGKYSGSKSIMINRYDSAPLKQVSVQQQYYNLIMSQKSSYNKNLQTMMQVKHIANSTKHRSLLYSEFLYEFNQKNQNNKYQLIQKKQKLKKLKVFYIHQMQFNQYPKDNTQTQILHSEIQINNKLQYSKKKLSQDKIKSFHKLSVLIDNQVHQHQNNTYLRVQLKKSNKKSGKSKQTKLIQTQTNKLTKQQKQTIQINKLDTNYKQQVKNISLQIQIQVFDMQGQRVLKICPLKLNNLYPFITSMKIKHLRKFIQRNLRDGEILNYLHKK